MYILVGLGNPGKEYATTRHNIGFMVIDRLADKYNITVGEVRGKALCGKGIIEGQKVILAKPQTFMNLSGESVRALTDYYKINEKDELIVVYDDISLDVGDIRIRKQGSAGGHNGMKSIISNIGHQEFLRVKVGIGEKPPRMDLADYVLGHFIKEEQETLRTGIDLAAEAVCMMLQGETDEAMNQYNRKVNRD